MNVPIPAEFQQFVESIIRSGSYQTETEVVVEALRLLKRREQLRRDVNAGIAELEEGKGVDGEEVFQRLQSKAEAIARHGVAKDK